MVAPRFSREERTYFGRIAALPCVICYSPFTQVAHVRYSDAAYDKVNPGIGAKPHFMWTLPMCEQCHREQHAHGDERGWWKLKRRDPLFLCRRLYDAYPDLDAMWAIIRDWSLAA